MLPYTVYVLPRGQDVAPLGGDATFSCVAPSRVPNVQWILNDTSFNIYKPANITQENVVELHFKNIPAEYNNTRIQCEANRTLSTISVLRIQGNNNTPVGVCMSVHISVCIHSASERSE